MSRLLPFLCWLPAYLPAQSVQAPRDLEVLAQVSVYFDFASDTLTSEAVSTLLAFRDSLSVPKDGFLTIEAHTDSIGNPAANLDLSRRRAASIRDLLVRQGVADSLIRLEALGELVPAESNASADGRQRNRRAAVTLSRKVTVCMLSGEVVDDSSGEPLASAMVVLHNRKGRDTLFTDRAGRFRHPFPKDMVTGIDIMTPCYFPFSELVKVDEKLPTRQVRLARARTGTAADIENLFFVGGLPALLERSRQELPRLLQFLRLNPTLSVEIAGHVNLPNQSPVPEGHPDFRLSVARAKVVHDFLLENGVVPARIRYRGYGNSQMRFPEAVSEEQQAANRRVEIRVLNSDCRWD